jgi:hypothetical protein
MVRFSGNPDDLPGFEGQKRFKNFGDQWTNILDFVRRGSKNNHAKRKSRGILLMDQVSVDREESFKKVRTCAFFTVGKSSRNSSIV